MIQRFFIYILGPELAILTAFLSLFAVAAYISYRIFK